MHTFVRRDPIVYNRLFCVHLSYHNLFSSGPSDLLSLLVVQGTDGAPFVLINARILTHDMVYWFQFYVVVLFAFACPLSMLTNDGTTDPGYGIFQLLKATFSLLQQTFNASPNDEIDVVQYSLVAGYNNWIFDIFLTSFFVIINVLMVRFALDSLFWVLVI